MPPDPIHQHVAHFQWRVLVDALQEATAAYWERRAQAFEAVGNARCDAIAVNCRRHAQLLRDTGLDDAAQAEILEVLAERQAAA